MNKTNLLKEATATLKALFSSVAKLSLSQFEDSDGKIYQYSVLEVGAEVFVATAEGSELAPNGEYKVDELTSIKVEDGKITEVISEKEEEVEVETEEVVEEALEAVEPENADELEQVAEEVAESPEEAELLKALIEGVSELVSEVKEVKSELEESKAEVEMLKEAFSAISKQPAKESKLPKSVSGIVEPNKDGNIKELQSIFSSIGKK